MLIRNNRIGIWPPSRYDHHCRKAQPSCGFDPRCRDSICGARNRNTSQPDGNHYGEEQDGNSRDCVERGRHRNGTRYAISIPEPNAFWSLTSVEQQSKSLFEGSARRWRPKASDRFATSVHCRSSHADAESSSRLQGRSSWLDLRLRHDRPGTNKHRGF